jgi:hypothetical protein
MLRLSKRNWLLFVAALSLIPACGDSSGANTASLGVDGQWVFHEVLADAVNAISCQDNGILTIVEATGSFSGDYQQTGACVSPSGPADNSGGFPVSAGTVSGTVIEFTQPGGPVPCTYHGSVARTPPNAMLGTLTCNGTVQSTQYHFTGTWQADAVGRGPSPLGLIGLTITSGGTNTPAGLDVEVSTAQGLIALFTAAPNGYSTSPVLAFGDYEVRLVPPGNCQVIGTNPVPVNMGGGSNQSAFEVSCS